MLIQVLCTVSSALDGCSVFYVVDGIFKVEVWVFYVVDRIFEVDAWVFYVVARMFLRAIL